MTNLIRIIGFTSHDPLTESELLPALNFQESACGGIVYTAERVAGLLREAESKGTLERHGAGWRLKQVVEAKRQGCLF